MSNKPWLIPTPAVAPPAPWLGGKRNLADRIIGHLAATPHQTYAEVFMGMGGVFLRRPFRARAEVINDLSADVATLFRVLQRHYVALMDMLRWQLTSRAEFERLRQAVPDSLTDLERAARFLYLQRLAFGGKSVGQNFGVSPGLGARFDVTKLGPLLEAVHERLSGVVIERLPWSELLTRYDREGVLFYLDPPYWGGEADYGPGMFERADFARMAEQLRGLKGCWLLSLNDRPEVRALFAWAKLDVVETTYHVSGQPQRVGELLISGGISNVSDPAADQLWLGGYGGPLLR
jgi:DNA adenine methylase